MAKVSPLQRAVKINEVVEDGTNWIKTGYCFWCPGCEEQHRIAVYEKQDNGAIWTFNENIESPTFNPSLLIKTGKYANSLFIDNEGLSSICHSFIKDGKIEFLSDCTHKLKSQTIELKDI